MLLSQVTVHIRISKKDTRSSENTNRTAQIIALAYCRAKESAKPANEASIPSVDTTTIATKMVKQLPIALSLMVNHRLKSPGQSAAASIRTWFTHRDTKKF